MGLPTGECDNAALLIGIAPPGVQDLLRQLGQPPGVFPVQPDDAHGPLDKARLDVFKARETDGGFYRGLLHGEGIVAALEMLMAQDGAAYNGQVGVRAYKVVGEGGDKVQELVKGGLVDLHGHVLAVEDNAVLVVVHIGGVLQVPLASGDGDGDDPVVGPGRVVQPACVALILLAQLALGVAGLGGVFGGGNGLGVLFGLGEVDGDIQVAVFAFVGPAQVLGDAIAADIVRVAAECIVPVRGILRADGILLPEAADDLPGHGGESAHDPGVKNIPGSDVVLAQALLAGIVQDPRQDLLQVLAEKLIRGGVVLPVQEVQEPVGQHLVVHRLGKAGIHGVGHQRIDICLNFHHCSTTISTPPWGRIEST